jgi:hypothetical protein
MSFTPLRTFGSSFARVLAGTLLSVCAQASLITVAPIVFENSPGYHIAATGTIATAGTSSTVTDWNLTVTTSERLAHYTPANTKNFSSGSISSDGTTLGVDTSPDGSADGGSLFFRARNPFLDFGTWVADFTGPNVTGGQAMYMAGGAFDFLPLSQPDGIRYVAANSTDGRVFELAPLDFNGALLTGSITTNGLSGALDPGDILAWDIYVDLVTRDVFNPVNSTLFASLLGVDAGGALTVNNPDGYLAFSKGAVGGRPYMLQLADFTDSAPRGGQAGYYQGRLAVHTVPLHARRGPWTVGAEPVGAVPEPTSVLLFAAGAAAMAGLRRRCSGTR